MASQEHSSRGDRFEILCKLGEGAMGLVYEAIDRTTHAHVALKELRTRRGDLLLRFKQEWRSVQNVQHHNLVELYDLYNEDDHWWFTMELVRGRSFLRYVRPGFEDAELGFTDAPTTPMLSPTVTPSGEEIGNAVQNHPILGTLDQPRLRGALVQLFEGLVALHDAQMVHRDIKPSNCLVTGAGRVVILDFGLITDVTEDSAWEADHLVGTVPYMAPEQASSNRVGPEADLYAAGVMLYQSLTGRLPFIGNVTSVLERKQTETAPRASLLDAALPPDLDDLCADLMAIDPAARPSAREALGRLGLPQATGEPSSLFTTGPIPRISHFVGRERELAELTAALADTRAGAPAGGAVTMLVTGESGVGKSALVNRFVATARAHPAAPAPVSGDRSEPIVGDPPVVEDPDDTLESATSAPDDVTDDTTEDATNLASIIDGSATDPETVATDHATDPVSDLVSHPVSGAEATASGDPAAAVVLSGRCYEREAVPYKGVDGVIDALSRYMRKLSPADAAALLPRQASLMCQVFPVLEQVEVIADAPRVLTLGRDPRQLRSELFAAIRELFAKLADRHPVIVTIDDIQWADADSMALLAELLRPPDTPRVLLIGTARDHRLSGERTPAAQVVLPGDVRRLELHGLGRDEAMKLARRLAPGGGAIDDHAVEAIVAESHGHPLFIDELIRHASEPGEPGEDSENDDDPVPDRIVDPRADTESPVLIDGSAPAVQPRVGPGRLQLERALWNRIERLDRASRALLEVVTLAGGLLAQNIAAAAAGITAGEIDRRIKGLRLHNLLRTSKMRGQRWLEPYHDRVRAAVIVHIDDDARQRHHRRIAELLEAGISALSANRSLGRTSERTSERSLSGYRPGAAEYEPLARHWREAGERDKAAHYAALAAREATRALAFDRAVLWFNEAIELLAGSAAESSYHGVLALRRELGDALVNAGRCDEAAKAYLAAAEFARGGDRGDRGDGAGDRDDDAGHVMGTDDAIELRRLAMEQYLRGGHLEEGFAILRQVVAAVGFRLPERRVWSIGSLLSQRAWLRMRGLKFHQRDERDIDPRDLLEIDITWSVAAGIAMADPVNGAGFSARNLRLSLAAGEPYRLSRALSLEAMLLAARHRKLGERAAQARELAGTLARASDNPHAKGLVLMAKGMALYWRGDFKAAVKAFDRSVAVFRYECTNVSDSPTSRLMSLWALFYLGELPELGRRLPQVLRQAEERGDLQLAVNVGSGVSHILALARDQPDAARDEVESFMARWQSKTFYFQHWNAFIAATEVDLYQGQVDAALERLQRTWPEVKRSLILRFQKMRIDGNFLKLRCALAAAAQAPVAARADHLRRARAATSKIETEHMPWSHPLALLGHAGVAALEERRDEARSLLEEAARGFDDADMALHATVARYTCGRLGDDDDAEVQARRATGWLREREVVNPASFAAMLLPGLLPRPSDGS